MTNFKKGDRVEILPNRIKWKGWFSSMDEWVGQIGVIATGEQMPSNGKDVGDIIKVFNQSENDSWYFPLKCLRNLEFHSDTAQSKKFTIKDEPLQPWEKF